MWNLATQSALAAIIVSTATAAALLLRSRKMLYVRFAAFACAVAAYYSVGLASIVWPKSFFYTSLSIVAGGIVIILAASFFDALIGEAGLVAKKRRQKTYLAGLAIIIIGLSPLSQKGFIQIGIFATAIFLLSARARLLWHRAQEVENQADHTRLQYLALGGALAIFAFCLDFASYLHWPVPSVGGIAIAIYLYFIGQTLWVSRLLDFHELLAKALVFACLACILVLVYGILVIWVDSRPGLFLFNSLVASGLILILFEPLKTFLEQQTTRIFFKEHFTFAQDLRLASKQLATFIELQPAIEFVLDQVYDNKRATHASIYLLDVEGYGFTLQGFRGPKPLPYIEGKRYPVLFRYVATQQKPILRESVQRRLIHQKDEDLVENQALLNAMEIIHSELLIPMRHAGTVVGILSVKDERLSEAYAKDEILALSQLGEQLAITIENCQVFNAIKERDRLASLGEMSAGLAHEIRNPLAAIKGAAQALDPTQVSANDRELLQIVIDEVNRLGKVVSDFLQYARPFRATYSPLNLNQTVSKTVELLEHDLAHTLELKIDLENNLPEISGDCEQIRQVLINLILNARDAMDSNGLLRISTRLNTKTKPHVELRIQDTGPGISPKLRDKLFIPFFTTKQRGTGLGLALSQRIVKDHGGHIDVRSVTGKGTTFIVKLPIGYSHAIV